MATMTTGRTTVWVQNQLRGGAISGVPAHVGADRDRPQRELIPRQQISGERGRQRCRAGEERERDRRAVAAREKESDARDRQRADCRDEERRCEAMYPAQRNP